MWSAAPISPDLAKGWSVGQLDTDSGLILKDATLAASLAAAIPHSVLTVQLFLFKFDT